MPFGSFHLPFLRQDMTYIHTYENFSLALFSVGITFLSVFSKIAYTF